MRHGTKTRIAAYGVVTLLLFLFMRESFNIEICHILFLYTWQLGFIDYEIELSLRAVHCLSVLFLVVFSLFSSFSFLFFSIGFVRIGSKAFWIRSRGQWGFFKLHPDSSISLSTPPFLGSETIPHSSHRVSLGFKRRFSSTKKPFAVIHPR